MYGYGDDREEIEFHDLPPMEVACIKCGGHGYRMEFNERTRRKKKIDCDVCHRTGCIPSAFGEEIIRFLSFYKPWEKKKE